MVLRREKVTLTFENENLVGDAGYGLMVLARVPVAAVAFLRKYWGSIEYE